MENKKDNETFKVTLHTDRDIDVYKSSLEPTDESLYNMGDEEIDAYEELKRDGIIEKSLKMEEEQNKENYDQGEDAGSPEETAPMQGGLEQELTDGQDVSGTSSDKLEIEELSPVDKSYNVSTHIEKLAKRNYDSPEKAMEVQKQLETDGKIGGSDFTSFVDAYKKDPMLASRARVTYGNLVKDAGVKNKMVNDDTNTDNNAQVENLYDAKTVLFEKNLASFKEQVDEFENNLKAYAENNGEKAEAVVKGIVGLSEDDDLDRDTLEDTFKNKYPVNGLKDATEFLDHDEHHEDFEGSYDEAIEHCQNIKRTLIGAGLLESYLNGAAEDINRFGDLVGDETKYEGFRTRFKENASKKYGMYYKKDASPEAILKDLLFLKDVYAAEQNDGKTLAEEGVEKVTEYLDNTIAELEKLKSEAEAERKEAEEIERIISPFDGKDKEIMRWVTETGRKLRKE